MQISAVRRWHFLFLAALLSLSAWLQPARAIEAGPGSEARSYTLWYRNYDSPAVRALLDLALGKTMEYGPYRIVRSEEMGQGRALLELKKPGSALVDIANVATSKEREKGLSAIPVPIDGGLLGFRVCVVLRESLPLFSGIKTLDDLRARDIRIGQGFHWPDAAVLEAGGIPVVTHARYEILFRMLRSHRFECFARGVSEVLYDLELENDPNLVIEPNLVLAYPMPSYFFVGPDDQETAERLKLGMDRAIHDGSFARFLDDYYGKALRELKLGTRTILVLDNPFLTEESLQVGREALRTLRRRIGQ